MLKFQGGIRTSDKRVNYSRRLAQTKQQGGQRRVIALLVHGQATGKHELARFTTTQTWGKPPPSPLQYILCLTIGPTPKCHFVPRLPLGSPEITKIGTLAALGAHNFLCRLLIKLRFHIKLQPSSRDLQRSMARHLHARKSGRFQTFSGWESNWQFDS